MIGFEPVDPPPDFESKVSRPGQRWLSRHSTGRPRDYWSAVKPDLAHAFRNLCAYSAMYEPVGTVDHFISCDEDRSRAYDWSNYRYASGWLNSSKSGVRASELVDPFEVVDGWFEIILPSLQLIATERVPEHMRERAARMLDRLHLGHDERVVRQRREWYRMYQEGELTLAGLEKKAPLIAAAVRRAEGTDAPNP